MVVRVLVLELALRRRALTAANTFLILCHAKPALTHTAQKVYLDGGLLRHPTCLERGGRSRLEHSVTKKWEIEAGGHCLIVYGESPVPSFSSFSSPYSSRPRLYSPSTTFCRAPSFLLHQPPPQRAHTVPGAHLPPSCTVAAHVGRG